MKALGEFLRPEFINRVDEVICFNRLDRGELPRHRRASCSSELHDSLEDEGPALHLGRERAWTTSSRSPTPLTYGARNLRRTIQKELEDAMAAQIIDSYEHPVTQIHASMEDGKLVVRSL